MNKEKKKLVIMGVLFVALGVIVFVMYGPGLRGGDSQSAASARRGDESVEVGVLDNDPGYLDTIAEIAKSREEKVYAAAESRDPMEALVESGEGVSIATKAVVEAPKVTLPYMVLNGIVWDPLTPIAMIDGGDVRVGETINGAKVIEINKESVTLSYKSKRFVLAVD